MLIFFNMMNSHGDETGIFDILEIKFFAANHGTDF